MELESSQFFWSIETILFLMDHTIEVTNDHSSCLFMLFWIDFVRNRIKFVNLRYTFCSAKWKSLVYFLKVKPCLFEIFIESEHKIEVCEKQYYNTLVAHIFTKIKFCVAKHWGSNICSLKIKFVTLFMKFSYYFNWYIMARGFGV